MQLFLRRKHFVVKCKFETKDKNYLRPIVYTCVRISLFNHLIPEHIEKIIMSRKGIGEKIPIHRILSIPETVFHKYWIHLPVLIYTI